MYRKTVLRILLIVMVLIGLATLIAFFFYNKEKPWLAFFIACGGGILIVNLIISVIFVVKNFKDKRQE